MDFDKERYETSKKRTPPSEKSIDEKWPGGTTSIVISLLETAFVPERIDNMQIYETLVAGPRKLDRYWQIVLTGIA